MSIASLLLGGLGDFGDEPVPTYVDPLAAARSIHLRNRRKLLRDEGHWATLSRVTAGSAPPAYTNVNLRAFSRGLAPTGEVAGQAEERTIGIVDFGDEILETLNDEIAAAGWPAPPRRNDRVTWNGTTRTVKGAKAVYDAALLIGWTIMVSA